MEVERPHLAHLPCSQFTSSTNQKRFPSYPTCSDPPSSTPLLSKSRSKFWRVACSTSTQKQQLSCRALQSFVPHGYIQTSPFCNRPCGENVISANNERHKRHRRVVGPAFAGGMYVLIYFFNDACFLKTACTCHSAPLVWEQTLQTYKEMVVDEGWSEKNTVPIDCINDYSHKV